MKIRDLLARYQLKTRQTLYNRLNHLKITLAKDDRGFAFASSEQIELLDQLHAHLQRPHATMGSFTPISEAIVEVSPEPAIAPVSSLLDTTQDTELLGRVLDAIASSNKPQSPLWWQIELERARVSGWLLSTSDIQALIGVKPVCKTGSKVYKRGVWVFSKAGKIGNETAWRVSKLTEPNPNPYRVSSDCGTG